MIFNKLKKGIGIILCLIINLQISFSQISFKRTVINSENAVVDTLIPIGDSSIVLRRIVPEIFVDTLQIWGDGYRITNWYTVSNEINKRLKSDTANEIFNDTLNQYSRLIFEGSDNYTFNVPTIPLTHIVYLKKSRLIVGLSKIEVSPYNIVIYSMDGKLLCKRTLQNLELKVNKEDLKILLETYPKLTDCLAQNTIVKEVDNYYIEISRCLVHILGKDWFSKGSRIVRSHYFPLMSTSFDGPIYSKYYYSFSDSDPINDLIMIGSTPYLLILNSEDGTKVNVPLLSTVVF